MTPQNPTALETLKQALTDIQIAQSMCVNEFGHVYNHKKYEYKMLVEKALDLKRAIQWFEDLNGAK